MDVDKLKSAASGRWRDILPAVAGIDAAILDGRHHGCPKCGGVDRFRMVNESAGAVLCNQCFSERNGDGLAAVGWMTGQPFPQVLRIVGEYLGLTNGHANGNGQHVDIVAEIARRKRVPLQSWLAFGAHAAMRGKMPVCRVPMYDETGVESSYFDLATKDEKWLKGFCSKGKKPGVFLAGAKTPQPGETVLIVEGCKDAGALHGLGFVAVGLPTSKLPARFARLFRGCNCIVVPDRDVAGVDGAAITAARLAGVAASVRIAALPSELKASGGDDIRDVLAKPDGESLVRQAIADAAVWTPKPEQPSDGPDDRQRSERVRIEVTPDQHVVIEQTINALAADPTIYKRSGRLVHVVRERTETEVDGIKRAQGTPRILTVPAGYLRERLAERCYFWRIVTRGENEVEQHVDPPGWLMDAIHSRGFWQPVRVLSGITESPVLRPDGTILSTPGWDEQTGLQYEPTGAVPAVPDNPSQADAMAALSMLRELVAEFPFEKPAHESAWLAGLLTVLGRRAFTGPAPLFLIDANVRGSGKSLLTDLIAIITTGREMPRLSNPGDDDEARKRITSLALAGDPLALIDNITSTLGSASLDAALTGTTWKDRRLGVNEMIEAPLRAIWFASGNNIVLTGDMSRRVCHVRLDSPMEAPEERTGFRFPNLTEHVRENRLRLLTAGLTILRAFVVAGRPDAGLKPWGSFEGWSGLIRNCVAWLGLPDPGETRRELAEASDRDAAALRMLFAGWSEVDPDENGLTAAGLVKLLATNEDRYGGVRDALLELCDTGKKAGLSARAVGNQLRRFKGRVIGDRRLRSVEDRHKKINRWVISACDAGSAGTAGSVSPPSRARAGESICGADPLAGGEQGKTHPANPAYPAPAATEPELQTCSRCGFDLDCPGPLCRACGGGG